MLLEPSKQTLARYGLSLKEWKKMAEDQGGVCFICKKTPKANRLCIDHEHVKRLEKNARRRKKKIRERSSLLVL
jgi:hypothetical protein